MKVFLLTAITMVAFAGNSLLCRLALETYHMDPASFTSIRLISGALVLWVLTSRQKYLNTTNNNNSKKGNWLSAFALFTYTACFSFAYVNLTTAMGALLLFGAVQVTMIGYGIFKGERLTYQQSTGLIIAIVGFGYLLWPGLSAPPFIASLTMITSGIAWGIYSLRGKGSGDPTMITSGNFLRSIPLTIALNFLSYLYFQYTDTSMQFIMPASIAAIISGAVTSGMGYALWYKVLPSLKSTTAATVQLSVPVIAAFTGIIFLHESMSQHLLISSLAILGGIALVITKKHHEISSPNTSNKN